MMEASNTPAAGLNVWTTPELKIAFVPEITAAGPFLFFDGLDFS